MRIASILIALSLNLFTWAQIPNGGFETWTDITIPILKNWYSVGNVSQSNESTSGDYSVRLDNDLSTGTFGAFSNAVLAQGTSGGQDYDQIPLTMTFSCKYDLASGDTAKLLALFKLKGQPLAIVDFFFTGSSNDQFVNISYPIQWLTQTQPDSLLVVVSSVDLESPSFNGNGYLIIDNIQFKSFSTIHDSVTNHDFEEWDVFSIPHPDGWYTTDLFLFNQSGQNINLNSVSNPVDVQSGTGAITLRNIETNNSIFPGVAITGKGLEGIEDPTFKVDQKWLYLQGLYKYQPENGDMATIAALMYKDGVLIAAAQLQISDSSRMDEYTYFSAQITYFTNVTPDSATVVLASADLENPLGKNTQLWVDNLSFTNHTVSIDEISDQSLVFPNPVSRILFLNGFSAMQSFVILDPLGREVMRGNKCDWIDVSGLPAGNYSIFVTSESSQVQHIKFSKL